MFDDGIERELVINEGTCMRCGLTGSTGCHCGTYTSNGKRSPENMSDHELKASYLDHQAELTRRQGAADDHVEEDDTLDSEQNDGSDQHSFDGKPQQTGRGKRAGNPPDSDADFQSPHVTDDVMDEADEMAITQAARLGLRDFGQEVHQGRTNYSVPNDYSRGQDTRQTGSPGFTYGSGPNPRKGTNLQYTTNEEGEEILGQLPVTEILANEARERLAANQAEQERRRNRRAY
jgi:hypothetical protein